MQKRFMITLLIFGFIFRKTDTQSGLKEKPDITFSFVTRASLSLSTIERGISEMAIYSWRESGNCNWENGKWKSVCEGGEKEDAAKTGTSIIENGTKRENDNPPLNSALA